MIKAFTMIELIFVIVILGILASVAIPKLMATRQDAKISQVMADVKDATKVVMSYYTAHSKEVNFSDLNKSNQLIKKLESEGWIGIKDDKTAYIYSDPKNKIVCFKYITNGLQIEIETNKSNHDFYCNGFKTFINDHNISILNNVVKY